MKVLKILGIFYKTELKPSIKQAGIEAAHVSFVSTSHKEPHNCPYCPMEYAHRTKLLKHCKEKHKDQPVPYKYKKWKARDLVEREVNQKARDIEKLIAETKTEKSNIQNRPAGNQTEPVPIPPKYTNKVSVLPTKTEVIRAKNLFMRDRIKFFKIFENFCGPCFMGQIF